MALDLIGGEAPIKICLLTRAMVVANENLCVSGTALSSMGLAEEEKLVQSR